MKTKVIEWDNEKDIVELITQLSELLKAGYKTVELGTYYSGTSDNGGYEHDYYDAKIVAGF